MLRYAFFSVILVQDLKSSACDVFVSLMFSFGLGIENYIGLSVISLNIASVRIV